MKGYTGKLLRIDLSSEKVSIDSLNSEYARAFVGGSGYASRLLCDELDFQADPLSPKNILVFMTGPLTGTQAPCTGRHVICARSPLTGFWGESNAGGLFGAEIKFAGFDGIVISGKANTPKLIKVEDDDVTLQEASYLWGLDTQQTQLKIHKEQSRARIACIGQAGENLVRFAGIVNEERIAARCGMGAVMGSKNLKAIVVRGSGRPEVHDPEKFKELALSISKTLKEKHRILGAEGTAMYVNRGMVSNDMPVKYFQQAEIDVSGLNADALGSILTGQKACYSCPIACGRIVKLSDDEVDSAGPEFQTIAAFGSNMLNRDIIKVAVANKLCNKYGLDTISCGSTITLVMDLCEKGLLDWGLNWGDMDAVCQLIRDIAHRKGRGDELAEGSLRFAKRYGLEEHVLHVKGLEVPNHDPRAYAGLATSYAIAARGASHTESDMHTVDIGIDVPELGIHSSDRVSSDGKGITAAKNQDYRAFHDATILCHFPEVPPDTLVQLLSLATGFEFTRDDILKCGSRIVQAKRLFNLKCGLTPADDALPSRLLTPLPESVTEDCVPDIATQLDEYFAYRDWDRETGHPN